MKKSIQIKTEDTRHQSNKTQYSSERYERSDRNVSQLTPPVVQLSPTPPIIATFETGSITLSSETEKTTPIQGPSPICVILDDDSSPSPSIDKKIVQQTSIKKSNENEKNNSKPNKTISRFR